MNAAISDAFCVAQNMNSSTFLVVILRKKDLRFFETHYFHDVVASATDCGKRAISYDDGDVGQPNYFCNFWRYCSGFAVSSRFFTT